MQASGKVHDSIIDKILKTSFEPNPKEALKLLAKPLA